MSKLKIAVLMGGASTEHEISLKSGSFIFHTLDRKKYEVKAVLINKKGDWIIPSNFENILPVLDSSIEDFSDQFISKFIQSNSIVSDSKISMDKLLVDFVFFGLHGGFGEDGTYQGLLDSYKIPYSGSGVLGSALAMDKNRSNQLYQLASLNVANFIEINKEDFLFNQTDITDSIALKFPVFVKPSCGGSSVGTGKAKNKQECIQKLKDSFLVSNKSIVQEMISGVEVSCGVLELIESNNQIRSIVLSPTEIVPKAEFFDFRAKYITGQSEEITPARLDASIIQEIQSHALLAHKVLSCRGYSRTDFIVQDKRPFVLETNTLPGMTQTSLIPQQAKYYGIEMKIVFDHLIQIGLKFSH